MIHWVRFFFSWGIINLKKITRFGGKDVPLNIFREEIMSVLVIARVMDTTYLIVID
jgi:hypothetical protein